MNLKLLCVTALNNAGMFFTYVTFEFTQMNVALSDVLVSRWCVCVCVCVCEFMVSLIIKSRGSNHTSMTI